MTNALEVSEGLLIIPEGVTEIRDGEFAGRGDIVSAILPDSLRFMDMEAFCECPELKSVRLPASLGSISPACFAECPKLCDIALPPALESIGEGAFLNCASLRSIAFPDTLRSIGDLSFWGTGLETVSIPAGVRSIGEQAFWSCEELRRADVNGKDTLIAGDAFGSCYKLIEGFIAPGYPPEGDRASELLYSLLWCSCPDRHGAAVSERAERFVRENEALIMERIFKYENVPALSGCVKRGLLSRDKIDGYVRTAADGGLAEMTALLLKARGTGRDTFEEFDL